MVTVEQVEAALLVIVANQQAPALNWAVNYARYAIGMIASGASKEDLRVQLLYVTNNMTRWRGKEAELSRFILKQAIKEWK